MENTENPYWSEEVQTKYHTPPGTFTQKAPEIVRTLMEGANGDAILALRRLDFYINRAGDKLHNQAELDKAKQKLEQLDKQ